MDRTYGGALVKQYTKKFVGVFLFMVVLIPACTRVKDTDLYGTYVAKYSFGTEKLILNTNGVYQQEITIKGIPNTLTHSGHWRYEPRDKYIELENGLAVQSPTGALENNYNVPFNGLVLCKVRSSFSWGRIRLGTATEEVDLVKMD
jgi:hypothetical protein